MIETRFAYNPKTKHFLNCDTCHSTALYNEGKQKLFDLYIRGIIIDKTLYLRTYYPLEDINEKDLEDIKEKSFNWLFDNKDIILTNIKKIYDIKIKTIKYNMDNDLLRQVLTNI